MKRWIPILPILLLLLASGAANAGGRWGVRLELPFQAVAYAEQVVWSTSWQADDAGPLDLVGVEVLAGTEAIVDTEEVLSHNGHPPLTTQASYDIGHQLRFDALTPYLGVAMYWPREWVRLEVSAPWRVGRGRVDYRVALSVGGSWD